jgi:hypothetical protein
MLKEFLKRSSVDADPEIWVASYRAIDESLLPGSATVARF